MRDMQLNFELFEGEKLIEERKLDKIVNSTAFIIDMQGLREDSEYVFKY